MSCARERVEHLLLGRVFRLRLGTLSQVVDVRTAVLARYGGCLIPAAAMCDMLNQNRLSRVGFITRSGWSVAHEFNRFR